MKGTCKLCDCVNQPVRETANGYGPICEDCVRTINEPLRKLLTQAADALEGKPVYDALANYRLIAELRKAAE